MTYLPQSRTSELVVQEYAAEILIYDLKMHQAISLNKTSAIVYQACDGTTTFEELKRLHNFTDDLIFLTLDKLAANDLLIDYQSDHFAGLSRREVIRKVGLASVIALPVIASIIAPTSAHAGSACTPGYNNDFNGANGNGNGCVCGYSSTNNAGYQLCNTTRGGMPDPGEGCQSGCLCQYTGTESSCASGTGLCFGTCR